MRRVVTGGRAGAVTVIVVSGFGLPARTGLVSRPFQTPVEPAQGPPARVEGQIGTSAVTSVRLCSGFPAEKPCGGDHAGQSPRADDEHVAPVEGGTQEAGL